MPSIDTPMKRPEAPIEIICPPLNPYSKDTATRPYAQFYAQALGLTMIEGVNVTQASPVRLPEPIEPGVILDLFVSFNNAVMAHPAETGLIDLFDAPRVIVTEWLTVQLINP